MAIFFSFLESIAVRVHHHGHQLLPICPSESSLTTFGKECIQFSLCPQLCLLSVCGDTLQGNLLGPRTLGGVEKSHLATFQVCHVGQSDAGAPAAWVEQWLCSMPRNIKLSSPEYFPMGLSAHPKGKKFLTDHFVGDGVVLEFAVGILKLCGCFNFLRFLFKPNNVGFCL